jgi:Protein of unknown function (DUF974)
MRLRKPNLVLQVTPTISISPFTSQPIAQLADSTIIDPTLQGTGLTGLAALPNGFGSMVVGTNFLAYVCLNNESDQDVTQVQVNAELRTSLEKTILKPKLTRLGTNELSSDDLFTLKPGEALHLILDYSLVL